MNKKSIGILSVLAVVLFSFTAAFAADNKVQTFTFNDGSTPTTYAIGPNGQLAIEVTSDLGAASMSFPNSFSTTWCKDDTLATCVQPMSAQQEAAKGLGPVSTNYTFSGPITAGVILVQFAANANKVQTFTFNDGSTPTTYAIGPNGQLAIEVTSDLGAASMSFPNSFSTTWCKDDTLATCVQPMSAQQEAAK